MNNNVFPFDAKTIAYFERQLKQIDDINSGILGAIRFIIDQYGLPGTWNIDWPGRCLVRADAPPDSESPVQATKVTEREIPAVETSRNGA